MSLLPNGQDQKHNFHNCSDNDSGSDALDDDFPLEVTKPLIFDPNLSFEDHQFLCKLDQTPPAASAGFGTAVVFQAFPRQLLAPGEE